MNLWNYVSANKRKLGWYDNQTRLWTYYPIDENFFQSDEAQYTADKNVMLRWLGPGWKKELQQPYKFVENVKSKTIKL